MTTDNQQLQVKEEHMALAKKLNDNVFSVIGQDALVGFEKAYLIAQAADQLQTLLSSSYMKPIMALQGNRLGFKTDKDNAGGYSEAIVKNCLIEAVLTGVQPFGNQFNIISGNCYITKEGFGYLLKNTKGLDYTIVPSLPRINSDKTSAAVLMKVKWTHNGVTKEQELDIPIIMNAGMKTDAVLGKATRKSRAWLFNSLNNTEVGDGDIEDAELISQKTIHSDTGEKVTAEVKSKAEKGSKQVPPEEAERIAQALKDLKDKGNGTAEEGKLV